MSVDDLEQRLSGVLHGLIADVNGSQSRRKRRKFGALQVVDGEVTAEQSDGKSVAVYIGADEKRVNDEAIKALSKCGDIYQRAGELVRVVDQLDEGRLSPRIENLPTPSLREKLSELCEFFSPTTGRVHPPEWCVNAVAKRGHWPEVSRLQSLVEYPVLLKSGQVLQKPGYDSDSFLLYRPSGSYLPVPHDPTKEEVLASVGRLLDLVVDFPFAQEVHKSAWLAGTLTLFARPSYDGPTPFFLIDGNVRGSGKSLLCDVASIIATGRRAPRTTQVVDETEERKRITAVARAGDVLILIDNISRPFGNGAIDSALTSTTWKDRLLGQTEIQSYPLYAVWWGTGNNVQFRAGADTARRTLHMRLLSPEQNPESRTDFKHPNLIAHVLRERPRLVADCLTILRGYAVANQKANGGAVLPLGMDAGSKEAEALKAAPRKSWGSFEGWCAAVRDAIVWAGLPDPILAHEQLAAMADTTATAHEDLVKGWEEMCTAQRSEEGCTIRNALDWLAEDLEYKAKSGGSLRFSRLLDAIGELAFSSGRALPDVKQLGYCLRTYRGRVVDGLYLETDGRERNGGQKWRVMKR